MMSAFVKNRDFLVCIDSDGCAMDTMDPKHERAFCPCLIETLGLQKWSDVITAYWMKVNLHSATRGVNRFKALYMTVCMLQKEYGLTFPGFAALEEWVNSASTLSNDSLAEAIAQNDSELLRLSLAWSKSVNATIKAMGEIAKPYPGVQQAMPVIHAQADISVVSSANGAAIEDEWGRFGLAEHTNLLMGQEYGSKKKQIATLLTYGYAPEQVMMVGDALGDRDAAFANGVHFFPILPGQEAASWQKLVQEALPKLLNGTFTAEYQKELTDAMEKILN